MKEGLKGNQARTGAICPLNGWRPATSTALIVFVYSELTGTLFPSFLLAPSGLQRSDHV